jgi:polygalacturonase
MELKTSRRQFLAQMSAPGLVFVAQPTSAAAAEAPLQSVGANVKQFGARGDGGALDTSALQQAIDACAQNGGGTVYLPPGRYLSGTLFLKSRVAIHLEAGATLLGSTKLEDYPAKIPSIRSYTDNYTERSLIYAENLEQIALQGRGVIDGQGGAFKGAYKVRPYLLRIIGCRDVAVRELTLRNSPMWVQHYLACDGVLIDGITVSSRCNANNDGIDIDGCHRVRIINCDIQSGDDAIVLKSTLARACKNVVITNCTLSSDCNAFKLGTESNGGFENIVLSNCTMTDTRLAGIALEEVDGGVLDGVNISNVTMDNVRGPIFIRLGNRARPFQDKMEKPGIGALRNVSISNIQARGADRISCSISGLPGHPVENVTLAQIRIRFAGGGKPEDARRPVPEKAEAYPEYSMFGVLPAYAFCCRHARNLVLDHVDVSVTAPDHRPSLFCGDVSRLRVGAWSTGAEATRGPVIHFEDVRDALIHNTRGPMKTGPWLRVGGKSSAGIELQPNPAVNNREQVEVGPEVPEGAVKFTGSSPGAGNTQD